MSEPPRKKLRLPPPRKGQSQPAVQLAKSPDVLPKNGEVKRGKGPPPSKTSANQPLEDPVSLDQLIAEFDPADAPDQIVEGLLHRGSKGSLTGSSKTFKTWCLIDLGLSVASGTPWWGRQTTQGKVLYLNFELQTHFFIARSIAARTAKGISALNDQFEYYGFRGRADDWTQLMLKLKEKLKGRDYALVIIDPIYKGLGDRDENKSGDISRLHNEIEALAVASGAAIVYGHHYAKGNQKFKNVEDRGSGSGVWARDPDSLIMITKLEEDDCYVVDTVLRDLPPHPSFGLRWEYPLMVPDNGIDISKVREPGKTTSTPKEDVLDVLREHKELHHDEWFAAVSQSIYPRTISLSTFKRRVDELKAWGEVVQVGAKRTDAWKVTA